jgi:hypothetical protein
MTTANEGYESSSSNALAPVSENSSDEPDNSLVLQNNAVTTTSGTAANSVAITTPDTPPTKETFWDKNKSWLKPVTIGVGGVSLIAIGFSLLKPKHGPNKSSPRSSSLSGIPKQKKKKYQRKKKVSKPKHTKKKAVALL